MAMTSYPFEGVTTSEDDYSRLFREFQDNGVVASQGATDLEVYGDSSGMQVKVRAGLAIVRGHAFRSTAEETVTISAAGASTRIDWVVLKLDPTANEISLEVVEGTAGSGAPSLTQTDVGVYELPLGQVTIQSSDVTVSAARVTDQRVHVATRVGTWTTSLRPSSPRKGQVGYNVTTSKFEYHDGSSWADMIPTPRRVASGTVTHSFSGADSADKSVTFPADRFSAAPSVVCSIIGSAGHTGNMFARPHTVDEDGCSIIIFDWEGDPINGSVTVHWIAVQES